MDINNLIDSMEIDELLKLCSDRDTALSVAERLVKKALVNEDISTYYSTIALATRVEDATLKAVFFHYASMIMSNAFTYLNNAYKLAYNHLLTACNLDVSNMDYKRSLLLTFADCPDYEMCEETRRNIANEILAVLPNDEVALRMSR